MKPLVKRIVLTTVECACILTLLIPLICLNFVTKPRERGFFCSDTTLKYPFVSPTVPSVVLVLVGIFLTLAFIIVVELFRIRSTRNSPHPNRSLKQQYLISCASRIVPLFFGAIVTVTTTDIGKYSIGRLRPYFLDQCKPDYSKINCSVGYVTGYTCTGTDTHRIKEGRLSFPSGHASFSFYVAVSVGLYLQLYWPRQSPRLLRPLLQVGLLLIAWFCTLSRIFDHHHHWTDVLTGGILGISAGIFTGLVILPKFSRKLTDAPQTPVPLDDVKSVNHTTAHTSHHPHSPPKRVAPATSDKEHKMADPKITNSDMTNSDITNSDISVNNEGKIQTYF